MVLIQGIAVMARPRGKTRLLTNAEIKHALQVIEHHRYPEKNRAILLLSFSLGLTAQEIARLRIQDVAKITAPGGHFALRNSIHLWAKQHPSPHDIANRDRHKGYNVTRSQLEAMVRQVARDVERGSYRNAQAYFPKKRSNQRVSRLLPLTCSDLKEALTRYLFIRIHQEYREASIDQATEPFFLSQKRTAYSPNTLQEHMKLMLSGWAGIDGATSLSGRTTLINRLLDSGMSMKKVQRLTGHVSASTTVLHSTPDDNGAYRIYDLRACTNNQFT